MFFVIAWLLGSLLAALLFGTTRVIGFLPCLIICVLLSPVIGIIISFMFDNKKEAEEYKKLYQERIKKRNEDNQSNNQRSRIAVKLQIFKENEKPKLERPIFFKRY